MADARMPEKFYELARPLLPAEREPGPQGGRRTIGHYSVLKVIWFVLVTGCRWKDVPKEMGCCGAGGAHPAASLGASGHRGSTAQTIVDCVASRK